MWVGERRGEISAGHLALWSVAALQTVSQAAPASAAALPPFLATLFRGVAVLQLDGVLLPPACTGAYAFESDVRSMMMGKV